MKNLGNIKILTMYDNYNIQFKYATPRKIDFFAFTLFEIIKHSQNFRGKPLKEILQMLEIPQDLHYIFDDRLEELKNEKSKMVDYHRDEQGHIIFTTFENSMSIESYLLTPMGEEAYNSKEIIEEPQNRTKVYIYDTSIKSLIEPNKGNKPEDSKDAIIVEMEPLAENDVQNTFMRIITENPQMFKITVNSKTRIFDLTAVPTGKVGIRNNISVSIDGGKLKFNNEDKKILKAFLSASAEEKNSIRNKMFNYMDIPQTKVNFDKAGLAVRRSQSIKMKVAFGQKTAIDAVTNTDHAVDIEQLAYSGVFDLCFAGITDGGKPLVYNYCEMTEQGYTIPLEELDNSLQRYNAIFSSIFEHCKASIEEGHNLEDLINFVILASPPEQKISVVMSIMGQTKDLENTLVKAKVILHIVGDNKEIGDKVKDFITNLVKENLSKGRIDADAVIGIMMEIALPKERIIRILAEGAPRTDKTINTLLAIDESATMRIYELVKLYNSLLKNGKLSEVTHNTNIYSAFAGYDRQYKKLKTLGFENYYKYDMPKNWDDFMKDVHILKSMFNKIRDKLEKDIVKQASDFFTKIEDDYDAYAPIDEKAVKKLLDDGDLQSAINAAKADIPQIAFAIRSKYEEALRAREKDKDPKANGERKGITLIRYTIAPKNVDEVYRHWRNLCTLVHKATAENEPLWKGGDENRKKALKGALTCYNHNLTPKGEKK